MPARYTLWMVAYVLSGRRTPWCICQESPLLPSTTDSGFQPIFVVMQCRGIHFHNPSLPSPHNRHPALVHREIRILYHQKTDQVIWLKLAEYALFLLLKKIRGEGGGWGGMERNIFIYESFWLLVRLRTVIAKHLMKGGLDIIQGSSWNSMYQKTHSTS